MAKFIVPLAIVAGGLVAEDFYLKQNYASFYAKTEQGLPKAYGLILLINVVVASFVVMTIGFKVGGARKKFQEEATAAGDKDAESRYGLPKMYAEGFSDIARRFNNMQRGHQQSLESFQMFLVSSIIGGWEYPVSLSMFGLLWLKARFDWAEGYAQAAKNRYDKPLAIWVWFGLLAPLIATGIMGVKTLMA